MSDADDDRWLAVLAGRAPADDPQTRRAAQLRDYLQRQAQDEQELDEASLRRIRNMVHAKAAFGRPRTAPAPQPSGLRALLDRLFPPGRSGGRYALVAGVALAVIAVPLVLRQPDEDTSQFKRAPAPASAPPAPAPAARASASAELRAADPARSARELESALIASGVVPQVQGSGDEWTVTATVRPADQAAVRAALQPYGIEPPRDGALRITVRRR